MYIIQQWPIITNLRVRGLHLCSVPGFCKVQNDRFFYWQSTITITKIRQIDVIRLSPTQEGHYER